MVDASDFHGQGVDRQRRDEFNNGETPKSLRLIREGTVKQCNNKTWKATHFRSGAHSLQVNENRSQFGHVNTVIGKCSLEDPVSEGELMGVEQFDYFKNVLENSMTTSEERVEQLRELRCRTSRWMKTATGSTAAKKG